MIESIRGSIGSGMASEIPEFFRTAVKHPALFRCQMEAGTLFFTGTIPPRQREMAVLRIAWLCRAPYEWGEHVDIAKRYGVSAEEIERVTQGSSAPGWSDQDVALLSAVEELLGDHAIADATWSVLSAIWSEEQLLEFPMLVGAYVTTALQQNTLRMRLAKDNPGLSHR
ncbi:carboxymuconolactone decarboxylase family protein [Sphingobium aromaticiconvertens]|uniref:carboxymuconolactone decarboxylase family protein n=1 Tax=Sphingobium aromaticiconvertens TaxID=365341 RepID=UPI0030166A89